MEISKTQIARLVLGYLKSEKCTSAFNEFLINSQYLKSHAVFVKNGKYFATRVGGLTLEDIVSEYSEISLTIQGKLEQTDYYDKNLKMKLSDQLLYILDHHSRSPSPMLPRDLNATPIESLPGNSTHSSQNFDNGSNVNTEKSTFMEYPKSSNTSPATSQKDDKKTSLSELDNQIQSIKQNSEKDPVFDKLLEEIIGHKNDTVEVPNSRNFSDKSLTSNYMQTVSTNENPTSRLNMQNSEYLSNKEASQTITSTKNCNSSAASPFFSKPPSTSPQNQFFLTPTGVLMVPSLVNGQNYIVFNNSHPSSTTLNTALTETDIMKMPTVILEDTQPSILPVSRSQMEDQQSQISTDPNPMMVTQSQIIMASQKPVMALAPSSNETSTTIQPETKKKKLKTLAPKTTEAITVASIDGEYFQVFNDEKNEFTKAEEVEKPCGRPGLRKRSARLSKGAKTVSLPSKEVKTNSPFRRGLDVLESPQKTEKKKVSKSLFKNSGTEQKLDVWDSDLRELLVINPSSKKENPKDQDTRDDRLSSKDDKFDVSDGKIDLSDDEELKKEALMIEAAFKTPIKSQQAEKVDEVEREEEMPNVETKSVTSQEKSETSCSTGEKSSSRSEDVENEEDNNETVITEETEVYLRNCNGPPRIKKKCNTTNTAELLEVEIIEESTEESVQEERKIKTKTFILETPVKETCPKTPGKFEITPSFSKALDEHLEGMDLLSFPTPVIPITPNIPMTPNLALTTPDHHSNRPTDYSTSSSYYQPSDTEQNKSLESMMAEYRREEKKQTEPQEATENSKTEMEVAKVALSDMKNIFNKNVIGKKNLNLMKPENSSGSDAENSNSSTDSSDNGESSFSSDSESDFDFTLKKPVRSPKTPYSYRKKKTPISKGTNDKKKTPSPTESANQKIKSTQKETAEKPKRTKSLKRGNPKTPSTVRKTNLPRAKDGKFIKDETKMSPKRNEQLQEKCDIENEITDDDFALHLSTDEDSVNKVGINKNKEENASITPPATTETAKQLIQDLYERGIHLLPKDPLNSPSDEKTAKKTDSECEFNSNALENLDVSSDENSSSETIKKAASELSSIENQAQLTFDIKCYDDNDIIHHIHDYSKRRRKKIYDLTLLTKQMHANVYIESKDSNVERIIKIEPEFTTFEYIPKKLPVKRRKNVKSDDKQVPSKTSTYYNKKQAEQAKTKKEEKTNEETKKKTETEGIVENVSSDLKKTEKGIIEISETNDATEPETKKKSYSKRLRSSSASRRGVETPNSGIIVIDDGASPPLDDVETGRLRDIEELSSIASGEDDLMNFAVLRNPIEPEKEVSLKSRDKRKCSSEGENRPPEKKPKNENEKQALLKSINVDLFLNKVHGDAHP